MSHKGLKSHRPGLLLDEENGKCGIAKYGAEFLVEIQRLLRQNRYVQRTTVKPDLWVFPR